MNLLVCLFFFLGNCLTLPLLDSYHPKDISAACDDGEHIAFLLLLIIDMYTSEYSQERSSRFESRPVGNKVYKQQRLKALQVFHRGAGFKDVLLDKPVIPRYYMHNTFAVYNSCRLEGQPRQCEMVGLPYPGGCNKALAQAFLRQVPELNIVLEDEIEMIQKLLPPRLPPSVPITTTSPYFRNFNGLPRYDPGHTEWPAISVLKALALHAKARYRPFTLDAFERFLVEQVYPGSAVLKTNVRSPETEAKIYILRVYKQSVDFLYSGQTIFDYVRPIKFGGMTFAGPVHSHGGVYTPGQSTRLLLLHSVEENKEYVAAELCSRISVIALPSTFIPPKINVGSPLAKIYFPRARGGSCEDFVFHVYLNRVHIPFETTGKALDLKVKSFAELVDVIHSYVYKDEEQDEVFKATIEASAVTVYDQGIIYSTPDKLIYRQDFYKDPELLIASDAARSVKYLSASEDGNTIAIAFDCDIVTIYNAATKTRNDIVAHHGLVSADGKSTLLQVYSSNRIPVALVSIAGLVFTLFCGFASIVAHSTEDLLLIIVLFIANLAGMGFISRNLKQTSSVVLMGKEPPEAWAGCTLLHATRNFDKIHLKSEDANFQVSSGGGTLRAASIGPAEQDLIHLLRLDSNASLTEVLSNLKRTRRGVCSGAKSFWYSASLERVCNHECEDSSDLTSVRQDNSRVILVKNNGGQKQLRILQPVLSKHLLEMLIFPHK